MIVLRTELPEGCICCVAGTEGSPAKWSCGVCTAIDRERLLLLTLLPPLGSDIGDLLVGASSAPPTAFVAGVGFPPPALLSGGHDALLLEGRRWWEGRQLMH